MNILIFRTPYNSIYIRIFRPHMYSRMLLSLGIAFIQLSRNEITNMTLQQLPRNSIERILYTSFVRLSRKIIELFKIYANRKLYLVKFNSLYQEKTNFKGNFERQSTISITKYRTWRFICQPNQSLINFSLKIMLNLYWILKLELEKE